MAKVLVPLIIILSLLLQGCASMAKEVKVEQVAKIEIGKSTKDNVLAMLGLPHKTELRTNQGEEKVEAWIYYKGQGSSTVLIPVGVVPLGGDLAAVFFSNLQFQDKQNIAAVLVFNEQGLVIDLKRGGT